MQLVSSTPILSTALAPVKSYHGGLIGYGPLPDFALYHTKSGESLLIPPIDPGAIETDCYLAPRAGLYTYQGTLYATDVKTKNGQPREGTGNVWVNGMKMPVQLEFQEEGQTVSLQHNLQVDKAEFIPERGKKGWRHHDDILHALTKNYYVRRSSTSDPVPDERLWQFHCVRKLTNGALLVFTSVIKARPCTIRFKAQQTP